MLSDDSVTTGNKWKNAVAALHKDGWIEKSRKRSHVKLVKPGRPNPIIIPIHGNKSLDRGTLGSIIRHSGLTINEFADLL